MATGPLGSKSAQESKFYYPVFCKINKIDLGLHYFAIICLIIRNYISLIHIVVEWFYWD